MKQIEEIDFESVIVYFSTTWDFMTETEVQFLLSENASIPTNVQLVQYIWSAAENYTKLTEWI